MDIFRNCDITSGFTAYWRIENFRSEPASKFSIKSKLFEIKSLNSKWQIHISTTTDGYLSTFLIQSTDAETDVLHYVLSALTSSGWNTIVEREKKFVFNRGYGGDVVKLETLKKKNWYYIPYGSLTISFRIWNDRLKTESKQCLLISKLINGEHLRHGPIQVFSSLKPSDLFSFKISYDSQGICTSNLNSQMTKKVKTQHTQTDKDFDLENHDILHKLFKEKEFSFVTLRTPTKEFSVHKVLLCAKSPVFKAMFERKMEENDCSVVDIEDINNETMALFVKFLHFQPLDDLNWDTAMSLYYAADKFLINSLKEQCVNLLKKELSIENICDLLLLADSHQDDDLMNSGQEYFCKNAKAILLSTQWKNILGHTELVSKLLCKLAETM